MSVFDNKDGFRPRDYSSTTRIRYNTEMDHWVKSIKSTQIDNRTPSFLESLSFLGSILGLIFSVILMILLSIKELIQWLQPKELKAKKEREETDRIMSRYHQKMAELHDRGINE